MVTLFWTEEIPRQPFPKKGKCLIRDQVRSGENDSISKSQYCLLLFGKE